MTAATVALAGDVMLGRKVAELLDADPRAPLVDATVQHWMTSADAAVANLECCISAGGERWPDARKPFFFRAPPHAADRLAELGIDAVSLANNHALDFGPGALLDTLEHLENAGITAVGAGRDEVAARRPGHLVAGGHRLTLLGVADHPEDYAARSERPGIAYAPLHRRMPSWIPATIAGSEADVVLVSAHWGPNMTTEPVAHVRAAASALAHAGATVVTGHSAHVPHGVGLVGEGVVCYDLGDLLDDYAPDPDLRNDLGFVWRITLERGRPRRIEALPTALDFCSTRAATGPDAAWVRRCLVDRCERLGTRAEENDGLVVVELGDAST